METQLERISRILKISLEEAQQVIDDDRTIDLGGRCDWEVDVAEEKRRRKLGKVNVRAHLKRKDDPPKGDK